MNKRTTPAKTEAAEAPTVKPTPPAMAALWFGFIAGTPITPDQATRLAHGCAALVAACTNHTQEQREAAFERLAAGVGLPELTLPQRNLFMALFIYAVETGGDL